MSKQESLSLAELYAEVKKKERKFIQQQALYKDKLKQKGYELLGQIGRGGYGVVYKAKRDGFLNKQFAIKVNFDTISRSIIFVESIVYEILKLTGRCPKIVDFFIIGTYTHIVLEYFEHNSNYQLHLKFKTMTDIKHYMLQVLMSLKTLKQFGIFHRDLKSQNFLYNFEKKKGMIVDFGMAQIDLNYYSSLKLKSEEENINTQAGVEWEKLAAVSPSTRLLPIYQKLIKANQWNGVLKVGTEMYCPLESLLKAPHQSYQCEIWAAGLMFIQFLTQRHNFFHIIKVNPKEEIHKKFIPFYIMQLAHLFGTQPIADLFSSLNMHVQFPPDLPKGDIRQLLNYKLGDRRQMNEAYDLLNQMLQIDPRARISVQDAILHPFFDGFHKEHSINQKQYEWYKEMIAKKSQQGKEKAQGTSTNTNNDLKTYNESIPSYNISAAFRSFQQNSLKSQPSFKNSISVKFLKWPELFEHSPKETEDKREDNFVDQFRLKVKKGYQPRKVKNLILSQRNQEKQIPMKQQNEEMRERIFVDQKQRIYIDGQDFQKTHRQAANKKIESTRAKQNTKRIPKSQAKQKKLKTQKPAKIKVNQHQKPLKQEKAMIGSQKDKLSVNKQISHFQLIPSQWYQSQQAQEIRQKQKTDQARQKQKTDQVRQKQKTDRAIRRLFEEEVKKLRSDHNN